MLDISYESSRNIEVKIIKVLSAAILLDALRVNFYSSENATCMSN